MRLQLSILSSLILIHSSRALPFLDVESLRPAQHDKRVAYSVVDVDGGAAAASAASPAPEDPDATTVIETADQTKTVTMTATPVIQKVEITKTVSQSGPVQTVAITVVAPKTTLGPSKAKVQYEVVNADAESSESSTPCPTSSSTSRPASPHTSVKQVVSAVSNSSSIVTTSTVSTASITTSSTPCPQSSPLRTPPTKNLDVPKAELQADSALTLTSTSSIEAFTTASNTHDNGMWHTSYPPWHETSTAVPNSGGLDEDGVPARPEVTQTWYQP